MYADHVHALDQQAYELEPYFGAVTLFRADEEVFDDPAWRRDGMGWSEIARGPFHKVDVPGAHLSILAEPNVAVLATELDRLCRKAVTSTPQGASNRVRPNARSVDSFSVEVVHNDVGDLGQNGKLLRGQ